MRRGLAWLILLPVAVRVPFWLIGFHDSPVWTWSGLRTSGTAIIPGLAGYLDPNAGWTTQALGGLAAQQWLSGHIPWWDPYSGIGLPLAASIQASALFLPYVLLLALPGGLTWLALAMQWTAGITTWRLLLRLDVGPGAALAGALLFALGACFAWIGPPANLPCAFLPLFLLGIERARRGWAGARIVALAVAFSLYAGFPETAYLDGLLALAWAVLRFTQDPGRGPFALRVAAGGVAGLLLAAPVLWPFLDLLQSAELGSRNGISMSLLAWTPPATVQLLAPYALGLPAGLSDRDATGTLFTLWGRAGGYLGTGLAIAAVLGGVMRGPERVLRLLLLVWAGLILARVMGVPAVQAWFLAVPFQDSLQVWRYAGAAWMLPCCLLAAFAVERSQRVAGAGLPVLVGVLGMLAGTATLAWPLIQQAPGVPPYAAWSLAFALLAAGAASRALRRGQAGPVLVAEAALLFMAPHVAGHRRPKLDWPAIQFLQAHTGLQRITTLGPFAPNYPALFGIASVNYSYLPLPALWSHYVGTALEPGIEPVLYNGLFPPEAPGHPTHAQTLAHNLPAYQALGVKYVLTPPGQDPFRRTPLPTGTREAASLPEGGTLQGALTGYPGGRISTVLITIGTYAGAASGTLELSLCDSTGCSTGQAALDGAADNQPFAIPIDPKRFRGPIYWTLRHPEGRPVALWRWPSIAGLQPQIELRRQTDPSLAYTDTLLSIYELPEPAPYFTAEGCTLMVKNRSELDAFCPSPTNLIRRELAVPGWTAQINGASLDTEAVAPLFQSVPLQAGQTHIAFQYCPQGTRWFTGLFIAGVAFFPLSWARIRPVRPKPNAIVGGGAASLSAAQPLNGKGQA